MTDHRALKMNFEDRRISDPDLIEAILERNHVGTLTFFDEPYPYPVPVHYGYKRDGDSFTFYFHTAKNGHKLSLIEKNPNIAFNCFLYLNRAGHKKFRNELQDYRSVTAFGKAEFLTEDDADEMLYALNSLQKGGMRAPYKKLPENIFNRLVMIRLKADIVTAKSNYPISGIDEVPIPPIED